MIQKYKFYCKQIIKMFAQFVVLPFYYNLFRWRKINDKLVIFADAHNNRIPFSMVLLYNKFCDEGYQVVSMFSDYGKDNFIKTTINMLRFERLYAQAHYVVICDYFLPASAPKAKKETKVIQLWHACGIFKKFAYDAEDDIPKYYKGKVLNNYSLVTVSSDECVPIYSNAMKLDGSIVKNIGVSRTDVYFDKQYIKRCRKKFELIYPEAKDKKIILWAPSFRGNAGMPYLKGENAVLKLREELSDEWYLAIRVHPHLKEKRLNCQMSTEELIPIADVLISDYSTVIFEYSLFNKPLVLFAPDIDEYEHKRGFYIDYNELPGRIVKDESLLAGEILREVENFNSEKMRAFREKYMSNCDGNSTERIFQIITKG